VTGWGEVFAMRGGVLTVATAEEAIEMPIDVFEAVSPVTEAKVTAYEHQ
jgi:hypothetical protein